MNKRIFFKWLVMTLGVFALAAALTVAAIAMRDNAREDVAERSLSVLNLYAANLTEHLDKFDSLPRLVAQDDSVKAALSATRSPADITAANTFLKRFSITVGALDAYILNMQGLTLAASNWDSEITFVGQDFSYRPYFREAAAGRPGRYFALGVMSGQRGYYFSYPVYSDRRIIGVAVIKADMTPIENAWTNVHERIIVTDPDGVIFISSNPDWKYTTLRPLPPDAQHRVDRSRRYPGITISTLPVLEREALTPGLVRISLRAEKPVPAMDPFLVDQQPAPDDRRQRLYTIQYLMQSLPMPRAGWTVHILSDLAPATDDVVKNMTMIALGLGILIVTAIAVLQEMSWYRNSIATERRTSQILLEKEEALLRAHDELEKRVQERTQTLWQTNIRLEAEIGKREDAQKKLRTAQDELVHAGKLAAIGQMAAGLTHEINQPLTAMRSYAENALVLLDRERYADVRSNITLIRELTGRMAGISAHLKVFARRARGDIAPVPLAQAIRQSLELIGAGGRLKGYDVLNHATDETLQVIAGKVRLEQVFVNLLGNSVQAMETSTVKRLTISVAPCADDLTMIDITVRDSGPGIPEEILAHLFEPFYSTKDKDGAPGLGLGLSISHGLIADFGGRLSGRNHPEGGAEFTVRLRHADSMNTPPSAATPNQAPANHAAR